MSVWNHLPLELHGAKFEPVPPWCDNEPGFWHWIGRDGSHRLERKSSSDWEFCDAMAATMRLYYVWWVLTGRDQALRDGLFVPPWKMSGGDAWHSVGILDADSAVPWPWPRGQKVSGDNLGH